MLRSLSRQTRLFSLRNFSKKWCSIIVSPGLSTLNRKKINDIAFNWACKNDNNEIAKMALINSSPTNDVGPLLRNAIKYHDANTIKLLLDDPKINNYKELSGILSNYLLNCYDKYNIEIIKILLADPRIDPSFSYNLALRCAICHGDEKIVELLLNDPRVDPTTDDNYAFICACTSGHILIVNLFLNDKRIDPWVNDFAAIKAACEKNHSEIVKLLLKRANE